MPKIETFILREDIETNPQCAWIDIAASAPYDRKVTLKAGAQVMKVAEGRYFSVGSGEHIYIDIPDDVLDPV